MAHKIMSGAWRGDIFRLQPYGEDGELVLRVNSEVHHYFTVLQRSWFIFPLAS